jgi:hypothetical protein
MPLFSFRRKSCLHEVPHFVQIYYCHEAQILRHLVISISSKSGGKNGKHCWVPEVSSITAISYALSQVFEHFIGRQFRAVPQAQTSLQVKQYALVPATSFLCVLENAPWRIMESANLQISVSDTNLFDRLVRQIQSIKLAIKNMTSKPRKGKGPEQDSSEDEEGT